MFKSVSCPTWRSVVKCDFQEDYLDDDHKACLEKERVAIICAEPVEKSVIALISTERLLSAIAGAFILQD